MITLSDSHCRLRFKENWSHLFSLFHSKVVVSFKVTKLSLTRNKRLQIVFNYIVCRGAKKRLRGNSLSLDEFVRIHSNFEISNFKHQIRMSNLVEIDLCTQIRLNLTSDLVEFDQIRTFLRQLLIKFNVLMPIIWS